MGLEVRESICADIRRAKYYSISVDSTPDVSHTDQLTFVLRYVTANGEPVERFLKFSPIEVSHTGENLKDIVLSTIDELRLNIHDCRGQSYDNAANMSGRYAGMQARIKEVNGHADYVPCAAHSLNLVGSAAVTCCLEAVNFFGTVQEIYNFAARSTSHWQTLTSGLKPNENGRILTLKTLSSTRWHCHSESVKALALNYDNFYRALVETADSENESAESRVKANSLATALTLLETAVMCQIWNRILARFCASSKLLQASNIDLKTAVAVFQSLEVFITELRDQAQFEGFEAAARCAMPDVSQTYASDNTRTRRKRRMADESLMSAPEAILTGSEGFRVHTYLPIIDKLLSCLCQRREAYSQLALDFSIIGSLNRGGASQIPDDVKRITNKYPTDLDNNCADEFMQFLRLLIELEIERNPHSIMKYLLSEPFIISSFPNVNTTLKIYLTLPVTVCEGERTFSRLALIKNRLRSCLEQDKLNALSILAIESDIARTLPFDTVIDGFCRAKARKKRFKKKKANVV